MSPKNDKIEIVQDSTYEVFEKNYHWLIPNFESKKIYSEKLVLTDELECTFMIVPKLLKEFIGRKGTRQQVIRSNFKVFFNKVPNDRTRQIYFQYSVGLRRSNFFVGGQGSQKVSMNPQGFQSRRCSIGSHTRGSYIDRNRALSLNVVFVVEEPLRLRSYNLKNFEILRTSLAKDYALLYKEMKYSDFKIVCADKEIIPAHKALLISRSPVLAKLLIEGIDTYEMCDVSKDAMMEFLRFLYCDSICVEKFDDYAVDLMELAMKFEITELIKLCEQDLFRGTKAKLDEVGQKVLSLKTDQISKVQNFTEICRCIKKLYKLTKNIPQTRYEY